MYMSLFEWFLLILRLSIYSDEVEDVHIKCLIFLAFVGSAIVNCVNLISENIAVYKYSPVNSTSGYNWSPFT